MEQKRVSASDDICQRVKMIFSDRLGINECQINLGSSLRDDLGADSGDLVELIIVLAQEFGCEVFDEDVRTVQTVGEMVTYIEQRCSLEKLQPYSIWSADRRAPSAGGT